MCHDFFSLPSLFQNAIMNNLEPNNAENNDPHVVKKLYSNTFFGIRLLFQPNEVFDYQEITEGSLIAAVYRKDLDAVVKLIKKGRSVNANDNRGYTSVHAAVTTQKYSSSVSVRIHPQFHSISAWQSWNYFCNNAK